jgi:hypothetical protein
MGTLLAYLAAMALTGGIGYGVGTAARGERRGLWRAIEAVERRVDGIKPGITDRELSEATRVLRGQLRSEMDGLMRSIPPETAALIEAGVDPLRGDIETLQRAFEGVDGRVQKLEGSNEFVQGYARSIDERIGKLITREEVQAAFAEVARATAAQQAAQVQQQRVAEAQRLLQRQQDVFGPRVTAPPRVPQAPRVIEQPMPAPARPQVPSDPDAALNAQLEALNRRMAEIYESGQVAQG